MLIHEQKKDGAPVFVLFKHPNLSWPRNFNRYFECIICDEGEISVEIDGISHTLKPGDGALIFPYTFYQYKTPEHSTVRVIIFGSNFVMPHNPGDLPESFSFRPSPVLVTMVDEICESSECGPFRQKALFYRICDEFLARNPLTRNGQRRDKWLRLFSYLQSNFTDEITLEQVAAYMGYDYYYLSKRIREMTGMSFTRLVAQYRAEYAMDLLSRGELTVGEIALKCGFGSIRNFNRRFKSLTGRSPTDYIIAQKK